MFPPREQRHTATEGLLRFDYARNRSRQKEDVSRLNAAIARAQRVRSASTRITAEQ